MNTVMNRIVIDGNINDNHFGKNGNLVKNKKMTKCWKTGSSSLKKIPTTNCVLKKILAPYGVL